MFHGMDVNTPQSIFRYLPVLSFTESYIYQVTIVATKFFMAIFSSNVESMNKT